ncbi:metallophosphoesterase [Gordonia sihwensis]|uniref:metallophosphoesterase n=1 Tax=Gordonia sihwensis TaxID=173559 RepID=UPI0024172E5C|nr:metallophosphoesterase [Gordonia sihwensis]WFN93796.1 metallophosphoesterase [Gordonia sihwensis]
MTITYVIPDVHGCLPELRDALTKVDLSDPATRLIFLGDYLDRGPDSAGVLAAVKGLFDAHPEQVIALVGNHERWIPRLDRRRRRRPDLAAGRRGLRHHEVVPAVGDHRAGGRRAGGREHRDGQRRTQARDPGPSRRPDRLAAAPAAAPRDRRAPYVHAGIDEDAGPLWESMTTDEVLTEKFPPSLGKTSVGKTIVAGHTGVGPLHAREGRMRCWEPFVDEGHVYLDGRVEDTGQLNVMRYDSRTHTTMFL